MEGTLMTNHIDLPSVTSQKLAAWPLLMACPRREVKNFGRCSGGFSSYIKNRFNPASFNTIFLCQTQFREAFSHNLEEYVGISKKKCIDLSGTLLQGLGNCEDCHSFWNRNQLQLPPENNTKAASSSPSYGPKMVLSHARSVKNSAINVHDPSIDDIISTKAIFSHHGAVCTAGYVPADA